MPSFAKRSYQKELLDGDNIPFADIKKNMQELDTINRLLGGHKITLAGIRELTQNDNRSEIFNIVEIGCGGGDNLRVIKKWAAKHRLQVKLTGIDINPNTIAYAETMSSNKDIVFICSDYKTAQLNFTADIIFSSLFCHHFTNEDLVYMLKWMKTNTRSGFFINDLHRHPVAYYSILLLTKIFSGSYLVKNDAPLSVRRGFSRYDWQQLFAAAGIPGFKCKWKWAFRWLVSYQH